LFLFFIDYWKCFHTSYEENVKYWWEKKCLKFNEFNNKYFLFSLIFHLICFGFCFYQIYKICEMYFSFRTTTSVSLWQFSDIPFRRWLYVLIKYIIERRVWKDINNSYDINEYLNKQTIRQQFERILNKNEFSVILVKYLNQKYFKYYTNSDYYMNCEILSQTHQSIDSLRSCFTFFSQFNEKFNQNFIIDNRLESYDYLMEMIY